MPENCKEQFYMAEQEEEYVSGRNLVICDSEENYAQALAMYFTQKKEFMMQVQVLSNPDCIKTMKGDVNADLLLVSEEYEKVIPEQIAVKKICILSSVTEKQEARKYPVIYKYQSGENILAQIACECEEWLGAGELVCHTSKKTAKKIIGVFSPVHRAGKTSYALRLGEKLAESENVLYINLELFGGVEGHFKESRQTISDVICYARQEQGNLGMFLTTVIGHKGNLDYIAPASVSEDVKEMKGSEWVILIQRILKESIYETVILDIDEGVPELYQLLENCTKIYMPVLGNKYAKAKVRQFEKELVFLEKEHLIKKIIKKEVKNDHGRTASCQNH